MNLEINNIGKIRKAQIDLRGLTVIVGDNNAGKSTIGKVLATLCYALPTLDSRILRARESYVFDEDAMRYAYRFRMIDDKDFKQCLDSGSLTEDELVPVLKKTWVESERLWREKSDQEVKLSKDDLESISSSAHIAFARLKECRDIPDSELANAEIGKLFSNFFNRHVKRIGENEGSIILRTADGLAKVTFSADTKCELSTKNFSRGWFLGSPLLINNITRMGFHRAEPEPMHQPLLWKLNDFNEINSVAKAVVQEKLRPVASRIEEILGGKMYYSEEKDELMISGDAYPEPLPVKSLSMGLKAFAVLFWMLEIDALRTGDVLVLDEPENHLHPSWQIKYAEIVVLLQMCFGLKVLLTTHSPYFLEAIQLFAKKYGASDKMDAYQPEFDKDGRTVTFLNKISDNKVLYRKFTAPLRALDVLRAELNDSREA